MLIRDMKTNEIYILSQAAEVGVSNNEITDAGMRGSPRGSGRGFLRGRARGRGTFFPRGGRGGGVAKSLKLDNRTRKLVVKGVNLDDEGTMNAVEDWYKVCRGFFYGIRS